jgi:hypothetical protein
MPGISAVVEYLPAEIPGHQRAELTGGSVAYEVKVADLLCDDLKAWAGAECL